MKRYLGIIFGSLLGLLVTRFVVLDEIEVVGWNLFWEYIRRGKLFSSADINTITHSATFAKCTISMLLGGVVGLLIIRLYQKREMPKNAENAKGMSREEILQLSAALVILVGLFFGYRWQLYDQCQAKCERNCRAENRGQAFADLGVAICEDAKRSCRAACSFP